MSRKIVTESRFNQNFSKFDICMSSVWNELLNHIHLVENHKSDIIIDIESTEKDIGRASVGDGFGDGETEYVRWFGFRRDGVDHYDYIRSTFFTSAIFGGKDGDFKPSALHYYRKLFKLTLRIVGDKMIVELAEKDVMDFVNEHKE